MSTILVTPRGYAKYGQEAAKSLKHLDMRWTSTTQETSAKRSFYGKSKRSNRNHRWCGWTGWRLIKTVQKFKSNREIWCWTDNIDLKVCEELRIKVGRCLGTNSNAVAELTVGMMFACARDLVANAITVKNGGWIKPTGFELKGKTWIAGFGNIGKNVARMAEGIGMEILVYDVFDIPQNVLEEYSAVQTTMDQILKNVILSHCTCHWQMKQKYDFYERIW